MKTIYLALLLLSGALGAFTQTIQRIDGSSITVDSLQRAIERMMREAQVSGLAISVFNQNKPVFVKTFGYADAPKQKPLLPTTVMYGASFSKAVFAYIVMQLVQEKHIDLDKPLQDYLIKPLVDYEIPGWKRGYQDLKGDDRYKKITGRMCLDHSTGFPNWRWFEQDKKLKIRTEPGTRYSYSGEGIYLLQFVVEQIMGKDLEILARERVFVPLGMKQTSYVWQDGFQEDLALGHNAKSETYEIFKWKESSAGGSMSTTLDDYTQFFSALLQKKGLSDSSFAEMFRTQIRINSRQQFGPNARVDNHDNDSIQLGYGLGFGVMQTGEGRAFFKEGHDDGWGHYSIGFLRKGIGLVVMTNSDQGESIFKELLLTAIGDRYTPWFWENYIPYNAQKQQK